jgi:hypothetical protein
VRRFAPAIAALALAGCGSAAAGELPAPAGLPVSPPLAERPAGRIAPSAPVPTGVEADDGRRFEIDRAHDRLSVAIDGRTVATARTGREPVALTLLDRGARIAVLSGRERMLDLYDARTLERLARAPAGIGPTHVASDGVQILYVTDTVGQALLVFHLRPRFELIRRVHLEGGPYAIAYDRERWATWITLAGSNRLVRYAAGNRPVLRESFPSIRGARAVAVDGDVVTVFGQGERQVLRRPRTR